MKMKTLCMVLLLAISVPGCSRFTKAGRMDRAYYKQLKMAKVEREKRRKNLITHQRAQMPSLRDNPPPLEVQTVQAASGDQ
jgi:hypothetical protein